MRSLNTIHRFPLMLMISLSLGLVLWAGLTTPTWAQVDAPTADLTNDGNVNILDFSLLGSKFGLQAGQHGYRGGLDLVPDGIIGMTDIQAVVPFFGQTGIPTEPTTLSGRVFDGLGNPLPGVTVKIGENGSSPSGTTDESGAYSIVIPPANVGDTEITFVGATASDPSPGGSGEYPTIPNKPIFINGGTDVRFRDMSLPERDLTGAVDLSQGNIAMNVGPGKWMLNEAVTYTNGGVEMMIPAGCTAQFPANENPVLSITRVDPSMLPVPMPPGLSSTIFVTYQPGSTVLDDCPTIMTKFDNVDGFVNAAGGLGDPDQPFLAGITNGVFTSLVPVTVIEPDGFGGYVPSDPGVVGPLLKATVPVPFEFAWYHVDVPINPCPRTTVVGTVRLNDTPMTPVFGASVSVPGAVPVLTNDLGQFSIPNVPAGPNGTFCFSNPFTLRASAAFNGQVGISPFVPAVPGGITNVGDIKLGVPGTVQGQVLKLSQITPEIVTALEGANVNIPGQGGDVADFNGNYTISNVQIGGFTANASFSGEVTLPGGGTAFKSFFDSQSGSIDFNGDIDIVDFLFTGTGTVKVTVQDAGGNSVFGTPVRFTGLGGDFGAFKSFVIDPIGPIFETTDDGGMATFNAPMGPCVVTVLDSFGNPLGDPVECFVNAHGQLVEITVEAGDPITEAPNNCMVGPDNFANGNGGFEVGSFQGYTVTGGASVITNQGPINPPQGDWMAFISTGGGAVGETTSTITTDPFLVPAGVTTLKFCANFLSDEVPEFVGTEFNDNLKATLTTENGPQESTLATVNSSSFFPSGGTGFDGQTGFFTAEFDVSAFAGGTAPCTLTFGVEVNDVGDTVVDSAGLIDNIRFE